MYQSGRAGNEAKKRKSPAKIGRVGIYVCCQDVFCTKTWLVPFVNPFHSQSTDNYY